MVVKHIDGTVEEIKVKEVKEVKKESLYNKGDVITKSDVDYVIINSNEDDNYINLECLTCKPNDGLLRYVELLNNNNKYISIRIDKNVPDDFLEVKMHAKKICLH